MTREADFMATSGDELVGGHSNSGCSDDGANELPPRPTSRLGFNGSDDEDDDDDDDVEPQRNRAGSVFEWTLGLFTATQTNPDNDGDANLDSSDSDEEDAGADYGSELLLFPPPPRPSLERSPPPEYCPPQPMQFDEVAHFSCLPSPLSPCYLVEPYPSRPKSPVLPRHDHRHHGRSHNALLHFKWFWSMREEEWQDHELDAQEADKLSRSPTTRQSLPSLTKTSFQKSKKLKQASRFSPLSIHPRRGDVLALRDPYCALVDRCFAELPMWTMAKTLWMFDLQMGLEISSHRNSASDSGDDSEYSAGCAIRTRDARALSTSSGASDDSDVTLVESDIDVDEDMEPVEETTLNEMADTSVSMESPPDAFLSAETSSSKGRDTSDDIIHKPHPPSSPKSSPKSSRVSLSSHTKSRFVSRPPYFNPSFPSVARSLGYHQKSRSMGWETDWYRRWDLLTDIIRLDRDYSSRQSASPKASCSSLSDTSRRFFFAVDDEGDEDRSFRTGS
ncbi:hypothetical protein PLEOSDRAFT_1100263 [Pleurotus ostreatus PC15]|uniref:Uncharacterized protein n=1 Tax=Pleurotus ostreatus (strain PC15) TaxID=1137138 RepID=A0A067NUI4_PLEO1|nr:hypothetical protein PLEOSDRAFT_1100263 [Pleurotus ostreatus PC15]